jgi:hypothetical protein
LFEGQKTKKNEGRRVRMSESEERFGCEHSALVFPCLIDLSVFGEGEEDER